MTVRVSSSTARAFGVAAGALFIAFVVSEIIIMERMITKVERMIVAVDNIPARVHCLLHDTCGR